MPPISLLLNLLISTALTVTPSNQVAAAPPTNASLENCPSQCGTVSLPYPFGFKRGCFRQGFQVECNQSSNALTIRLPGTNIAKNILVPVTNMSLDVVTVQLNAIKFCGAGATSTVLDNGGVGMTINPQDIGAGALELRGSPFTLSLKNRLVVLGCSTVGELVIGSQPVAICGSTCTNQSEFVNGTCSTVDGCCQSVIPKNTKDFLVVVITVGGKQFQEAYKQVSPCSYAFLIDSERYVFQSTDLYDYSISKGSSSTPVVLDWAIGNHNCSVAVSSPDYACGANASCLDSANGPGYRCSCNSGFTGNPYLADGCQDIDECQDTITNICSNTCTNTVGNFTCSCPVGTYGDGLKEKQGCISIVKRVPLLQIILGTIIVFFSLLLGLAFLYWCIRKRKLMRLRERLFEQNGGWIMRNILSSHENATQIAKIFSEEELMKATDNYSKRNIIGQGGFGTVYLGKLPDKTLIAIKKSKIEDDGQVEQFVNEIVILSQIKHRNVVKILGCCLDSHVPFIAYEYISNGTLHYHLHGTDRESSLSWPARLRIAVEIADAISYLHSFASQPIVHRDIKSSNILLDENYCVKLSDFGISKIIPSGETEEATMLQGTWGYIDPECYQTGQLTSKSDIYSFGVILAELLTGKSPMLTTDGKTITLASHFVVSMLENIYFEILEPRVKNEGNPFQLQAIGELTRRCLSPKGIERSSMREIAAELNKLQNMQNSVYGPYGSTEEAQFPSSQHSSGMSCISTMTCSSTAPLLENVA